MLIMLTVDLPLRRTFLSFTPSTDSCTIGPLSSHGDNTTHLGNVGVGNVGVGLLGVFPSQVVGRGPSRNTEGDFLLVGGLTA